MEKIKAILKPERMKFEMFSSEKDEAIQELADLMVSSNIVSDRAIYLKKVAEREALSTTGIGFGVAIPHGKSAVVSQSALAFGRSEQGVNYNSMDGKPVHLMFLIAVPESSNDEHLKILSALARKLMHEEIRQGLMKAKSCEEIYSILD